MGKKSKVVQEEFNIEQLFGSKTRVRLLTLFLENPGRSFYVRELTRRIGAQLNSVRRELKNLVENSIVSEVEGKILPNEKDEKPKKKKTSKKKYYQANTEFTLFNEFRSIMKKSAILMNKDFIQALTNAGNVKLVFLTGRFIDDDSVPSDILVVGEIEQKDLESAINVFEKQLGREVNYTYMPSEEFNYRKEVKDRFLSSLVNTEKVVLINELAEEL